MKKLISVLILSVMTMAANALDFHTYSFIPQKIRSFTVTNAAAAPLGGYTNINSWSYAAADPAVTPGTNSQNLTWTNANGTWVIPTNSTLGTVSGLAFVTNNSDSLTVDVPLFATTTGLLPITVLTNGAYNEATVNGDNTTVANAKLFCQINGAASAANTLNLIFIGVPDGTNEDSTLTTGNAPTFQWGITAAAGITSISTNFPMWRFPGCKSVRLRSGTLTTTAAANIGVTVQKLELTGWIP